MSFIKISLSIEDNPNTSWMLVIEQGWKKKNGNFKNVFRKGCKCHQGIFRVVFASYKTRR